MILYDLEPDALRRLEAALRLGESVSLELKGKLPRGLRADDIMPLFDGVKTGRWDLQESLKGFLPPPATPGAPDLKVCAVIPTHRQTPIGLAALRAQDCRVDVLVLANGDFHPQGDRVLRVPWEGHGPTRNRGVAETGADYILFTVDDALPRGAGCVRRLVNALEEGRYDAVFGRQVPWPSSDLITRERLRAWTPPGIGHRRVERLDNVFALYRRETLLRHPFPPVSIGEDLRWRQGRRIGYVPEAPVIHAHPRRPADLYRRNRDIHLQHIAAGDPPTVPDAAHLLQALPGVARPALRAGLQELPNQLAELLGQWRAARLSRKGSAP